MDLFGYMKEQNLEQEAPLASRLRPSTLDEVVGQEHIIGKDKLLYRAQSGQTGQRYFLRPSGNRKDYPGESDRQYHQLPVPADQRYRSGKKGHGRGGKRSPGLSGYVWKEDDSFY